MARQYVSHKKPLREFFREDRMVRVHRHRDKKAGLTVCDYDDVWLRENITTKPCCYCGSSLSIGADRIDNSKGHTKDNVIPCCKACNVIRNRFFTIEEFKLIATFCKENNIDPWSKVFK